MMGGHQQQPMMGGGQQQQQQPIMGGQHQPHPMMGGQQQQQQQPLMGGQQPIMGGQQQHQQIIMESHQKPTAGGVGPEPMMTMPPPPTGPPPPPPPALSAAPLAPEEEILRPEDSALHITVSDPVQHSEGMNKFTSYRVDVRGGGGGGAPPIGDPSHHPGHRQNPYQTAVFADASDSAVLRRYSDFLWLYSRLHAERAGAVVPPLPEKRAVDRFTPAFVEERRAALELFLRRVAVHPELSDSACLDTFLRADDVTFRAAKSVKEGGMGSSTAMMQSATMMQSGMLPPGLGIGGVAQPQLKKDGFKRWFAEAKTSMSGDLVSSPDDDLFEEIERYVSGLDVQMRNVSVQSSNLVRKGKEIANGYFEFGLAFSLLGQSEADALGDALGRVGEAADALSVLSAEHADGESVKFESPLGDYVKTVHAVKLALSRRHEKRLTYTTALGDLNAKNSVLLRLRATPGYEDKSYRAEMSLRRAQDVADAARDDFMTVSQRVLREVDRFKREKADDMRRTVLDYIELQVSYNRRMEEVWARLIPALESLGSDGGGDFGGGGEVGSVGMASKPGTQMPTTQSTERRVPQQQQYSGGHQVMGGVLGVGREGAGLGAAAESTNINPMGAMGGAIQYRNL